MTACGPTFAHLDSLTDRFGTFEHARYARVRPEHGYCTDDVARVLVVTLREPDPAPEVSALTRNAFRFVREAQDANGNTRNRRAASGRWHGPRTVEDCWGRSLWAFGVAVERRADSLADAALAYFERGAVRRSPWPRSMAYAALGAAAVLEVHPRNRSALALLSDAADLIGRPTADESWPWPEPRLTYANALLPDALLAAGSALGRPALIADGLRLLEWLLDRETVDGHLSVTPAGGSGPRDPHGFDQQPIEVATLAEACARAAAVTGDARWAAAVRLAAAWFDGDNDTGARMWDPTTGGGYDGLQATGVNLNQGAESTIVLISTRQHARVVDRVFLVTPRGDALALRNERRFEPDASRVVAQLFVAGQEVVGASESRASGVVARILALDEEAVQRELADLVRRFGDRHRDLLSTFSHHADRVANRLDTDAELSAERWLLLGATFTHEYSIEAASLCNPSIIADPDQSSAPVGSVRFVMSVRGIGEGHRSSIGFRTGTIDAAGEVIVEDAGPFPTLAAVESAVFDREQFAGRLRAIGEHTESATYVLDHLDDTFSGDELEWQIGVLAGQQDTRPDTHTTAALLRSIASCSYTARFSADTATSERVLAPAMAAEARGMEDARFVRFVDDDGAVMYYATYTAFDGVSISQQLLRTTDFLEFVVSPMIGPAATNKGLALFPRRIGGQFFALSRHDRETNAVTCSDSLLHWDRAVTIQTPDRPWEVIQLGNCGSPIETDEGWLVLTHGVGPMRTYSIGALLLDLDDPTKVIRTLPGPLLTPGDEQDGYVPNVVYSCGALLHGETLVIPHGVADTFIAIATVPLPVLLDAMVDLGTMA